MCRYGTRTAPARPASVVPRLRQPRLEEHEQRRVLAPVGEQRREPRDPGCRRSLNSKTIASPSRAVMAAMCLPCGGLSSSIARPGRGGRHARIELAKTKCLTPVPEAASSTFRRPTTFVSGLGILDAGEIVVRREVDDRLGPAVLGNLTEDRSDLRPLRHIGLEPRQVGVGRDAAPTLRPPRDGEDPIVVAQRLDQVPPDNPDAPVTISPEGSYAYPPRRGDYILPRPAVRKDSPIHGRRDRRYFQHPSWRPRRSL